MTPNPIKDARNGSYLLHRLTPEKAWEVAIDCVDYPVEILPLYFKTEEEDQGIVIEEYLRAEGETNTGRSTKFFGVCVDRNRSGHLSTISTVTGIYGTMPAKTVYEQFRDYLKDTKHTVREVYVTGDGGSHLLKVDVGDVVNVCGRDTQMTLFLRTSVDGKSKHVVQVSVTDLTNNTELMGLGGTELGLSTRHTKSIDERHIAFGVVVDSLTTNWEKNIVPLMDIMGDTEFDVPTAMEFLENIIEESGLPKKHAEHFTTGLVLSGKNNSLDLINHLSGCYAEAFEDKRERLDHFRAKLNKSVKKIFDKFVDRSL